MNFEKFVLDNGLRVIFHQDKNTSIAALNIIYDVGAKDEDPEKTGWAHLLEHLMFEGSINIPDYDKVLENAGGSNNAFTNNDYTNYYLTLPKNNIETALWLESDRMLNLSFNKSKFKTQKNVVIEEFKQTTLNEPYGDDMALIADLSYKNHPYKWTTIGKDISHIEKANLPEIKQFYNKFYSPNNAILSIGGDFEFEYIKNIVTKWFADIPKAESKIRNYPSENTQNQRRFNKVYRDVPFDMIYLSFHYGARTNIEFYIFDIITDILDAGKSSRLYQNIVKKNHVFDDIDAFITGNIDAGLIIFSGRPADGISMEDAENAIWKELDDLKNNPVTDIELKKTINSLEFGIGYMQTSIMSKTRNLAYFELINDVNLINTEKEKYSNISAKEIQEAAKKTFTINNSSVIHYISNKKQNNEQ